MPNESVTKRELILAFSGISAAFIIAMTVILAIFTYNMYHDKLDYTHLDRVLDAGTKR